MENRSIAVVLAVVTIAFSAYTVVVIADHGYTGFISLALSDAWGGQMLIDLVIALVLFASWMQSDAREHGISSWPYLVLICGTGSIGALAYCLHRALLRSRHPMVRGSRAAAP